MKAKSQAGIARSITSEDGFVEARKTAFLCAGCLRRSTAPYGMKRPGKPGVICIDCVTESLAIRLPPAAAEWTPESVLELLGGNAAARISGLLACIWHSEKTVGDGWYGRGVMWKTLPLGESKDVARAVLACANFPGDERDDGLVRLLAAKRVADSRAGDRMTGAIMAVGTKDPPELILGAARMVAAFFSSLTAKLQWLCTFENHPDSQVVDGVLSILRDLGVDGFQEANDRLDIREQVEDMIDEYKADELKALAKMVRTVSGLIIPGTVKEDLATGLVQLLGTRAGMARFYERLSPQVKKVVEFMAWRKDGVPLLPLEKTLGFPVVERKEKTSYYYGAREVLLPEFDGILTLHRSWSGSDHAITMNAWLGRRIKPVLPPPEKATLKGTDDPPDVPGGWLIQTEPSALAPIPALETMLQQGVVARKKNGAPTAAAMRSLAAMIPAVDEFFPGTTDLELTRCAILARLADFAPLPKTPRTETAEVLKTWLERLATAPSDNLRRPEKIDPRSPAMFILPFFMEHLGGCPAWASVDEFARACLNSLNKTVDAIPAGKWVTLADIQEFMLYNDLTLPMPYEFRETFVSVESEWGSRRTRVPIGVHPQDFWETPLVRTFFLILAAVGAVDALVAPPVNPRRTRGANAYLVPADGLKAVRLSQIGEWHFRNGAGDFFETRPTGRVVLDERRLLIRLAGNNPVLRVALQQVAHPLGNQFYRIDGGSFLKDCTSHEQVERKIHTLKSLLPDTLPPVWDEFFKTLLGRVNPLAPTTEYTVLEAAAGADIGRLMVSDPVLKKLALMAEGGRVLVNTRDRAKFRKRLKELGYFSDSF